jgi:diaminopimelate decarboxylase
MPETDSVEDNPIYRDDAAIRRLVEEYNSPLYAFDESTVRRKCREIKQAIPYERLRVRYACKALSLQAILKIVLSEGLWIDASSINEVHRALMAGFPAGTIYYTGEGAALSVYEDLVTRDILVNCTSIDQIHLLSRARGTRCSIRINPGEGHGANTKTNTGGPSSKHGIYYDQIAQARSVAAGHGIKIVGVHSHIGSGTDLIHWLRIKDTTLELAREFPDLQTINLGGGLPVVYDKANEEPMQLREWGAALADSMRKFSDRLGREIDLQIEPGRFIVAQSGVLIAEAQAVKRTTQSDGLTAYDFVIVNTGLNHNIRPALYGSYHPIRFISRADDIRAEGMDYVVAGYLCESGDVFTIDGKGTLMPRPMSEVRVGDIMAMAGVGAYSHALKSEYNSMNLPASVLVDMQGRSKLIERRGTLQDIMRREVDLCEDDDFAG